MSALSRRSVLSALLTLASMAVVPGRATGASRSSIVEDVTSWLGPEAVPVGQRYLQLHSAEADLDVLIDLLLQRLHGAKGSDVSRVFSMAVQEDFGREDVVNLDGWLLSRTEVRLCALAYLADHTA